MEIRLNHIGIIKDSSIRLNGLTVITGRNNSGKSTVGKVLYSLVEGLKDIRNRAEIDKRHHVLSELRRVLSDLIFFDAIIYGCSLDSFLLEKPALGYFIKERMGKPYFYHDDIKFFLNEFLKEINELNPKQFGENKKIQNFYKRFFNKSKEEFNIFAQIEKEQNSLKIIAEKLLSDIAKDESLDNYRRESVNKTLRKEFSLQIQPIMHPENEGFIELSGESEIYLNIRIKKDIVEKTKSVIKSDLPFKKVFFIDNPFILDRISNSREVVRMLREFKEYETDTFLDVHRIVPHDTAIINFLKRSVETSVFEDIINNNNIEHVKSIIDDAIPGSFEFSTDGSYIINKGKKLSLSNLATGSKFFSILKILIEKNALDGNTVLILDEPESHLHPEWENIVAEITVLLAKELGVNILLTTHSSNFMLAVDAYSKKYDFTKKSNFYQTEETEDGFVKYKLVNDNMEKIYTDFFLPFSAMKQLRNEYSKYDT